MKRNFLNVAKFLEDTFPELKGKVEGGDYPASPLVELLQNVLSVVQLVGLLWAVMGGETLLGYLGYKAHNLPGWYYTISNNSMQIAVAIFLLAPQIVSRMSITGAFEIYYNDQQVWSKLSAGSFPSRDELVAQLNKLGLGVAAKVE